MFSRPCKEVQSLAKKVLTLRQDLVWRCKTIHVTTWTELHEEVTGQMGLTQSLAKLCTKFKTRLTIELAFEEISKKFRLFWIDLLDKLLDKQQD